MTDPIVEIHYIKPGSTKPLSPSIDIQLPKEKKVPAVQTFQIPNSTNMAATRAINETILSSGQTKNGPQDRFVYQPNGTYTHIPYDSKAMKSGFKQFYDYIADIHGFYLFFCLYNNFNRCNNFLKCCKEGLGVPVYMVFVFVAMFLAMLFVFIMLGLAGTKYNGRYIIG